MEPVELTRAIKAELVDANVKTYEDLFRSTDRDEASDPYWAKVLAMFDSLPPASQGVLFQIMRQVAVDTVSNMLGVLDGSSTLPGVTEDFHLTLDSDKDAKLNGELQGSFLELIEDE